jgi:hypothetical protein
MTAQQDLASSKKDRARPAVELESNILWVDQQGTAICRKSAAPLAIAHVDSLLQSKTQCRAGASSPTVDTLCKRQKIARHQRGENRINRAGGVWLDKDGMALGSCQRVCFSECVGTYELPDAGT